MTYYKAFDKDLRCRGLQYKIGETTTVEGEIEMCKNGLHCCEDPLSCLQYYERDISRFCEVSPEGEVLTKGDKSVCKGLAVVREIIGEELSSLLTGPCKLWHENGQLAGERVYKDGKLNGLYKRWYANGHLRCECTYKDGKPEGPCKEWYENGQLWLECSLQNNKLEGLRKSWHTDGRLKQECTYKDGKLDGRYKYWHENGQLR